MTKVILIPENIQLMLRQAAWCVADGLEQNARGGGVIWTRISNEIMPEENAKAFVFWAKCALGDPVDPWNNKEEK